MAKAPIAPSPRVNVGIARTVHQAVKESLEKDETLVGFIEFVCLAEVQRRKVDDYSKQDRPPLTATEASMDLRRDQEVERNKREPKSELDELKEQVARLTDMMSRAIPRRVLEAQGIEPTRTPEAEEQAAEEGPDPIAMAVDRTALTGSPTEMVIDWNLVPENVPDGSRLITEADDDGRPGVCVQFWRLSTGKSLKTSTRGSVMVLAQEPGPGGLKPGGNASSGGFSETSDFDSTLNTPEDAGPLSPVLPARTAARAPYADVVQEERPDGAVPLMSPRAYVNAAGRKVRPSNPTRNQASRIQMLNNMVDGARMGSNAPKTEAQPIPRRPSGSTTPPTRPPARRPAPAPPALRKPVPRASFE